MQVTAATSDVEEKKKRDCHCSTPCRYSRPDAPLLTAKHVTQREATCSVYTHVAVRASVHVSQSQFWLKNIYVYGQN